MSYNKKPDWIIKNTIFYVDYFNKDIFECKITSIIDENTVSILPATNANNRIPKTMTIEDIGKNFFWVLNPNELFGQPNRNTFYYTEEKINIQTRQRAKGLNISSNRSRG